MFASRKVRRGVLPWMLSEILATRFMCKREMKKAKGREALERVLFARQFALKLIANVTYGYTSASFSGRMPMAELADSIVACGRRTLLNAIEMVESNKRWGAKVVYGDTDSMFVLLEGRSRQQAFEIGAEIAKQVSAANPEGVVLKFEKVYHPCILPTKKRYVGHMYESPKDVQPVLEAKGIEIVRRDQCSLTQTLQEHCLDILFRTLDLSEVKRYLIRQLRKVHRGDCRGSVFVLCKEVRLGTYNTPSPQAIVAKRRLERDPRNEARHKERVPFIVVCGPPKSKLRENVVAPEDLYEENSQYRVNHVYYITKHVLPALDRLFSLLGADVKEWYNDMPKPRPQHCQRSAERRAIGGDGGGGGGRGTMMHFLQGDRCRFCNAYCKDYVCDACREGKTPLGPGRALVLSHAIHRECQQRLHASLAICNNCLGEQLVDTASGAAGGADPANGPAGSSVRTGTLVSVRCCSAVDCPNYYERHQATLQQLDAQGMALNLESDDEDDEDVESRGAD
eukprot:CAMPEP_0118888418 /NCGR_PEP_ID=MMETSP1163-20130328/25709_1 /TAXON_ID=124430 /ORGANISM="Phaeomonas parva, Strain CCMP2877" /LENGTH=509 /DNA_ID=CAMNT_0006826981 /DNA_START=1 /DNA_END=1530 /DNA_ORIENTATION=+